PPTSPLSPYTTLFRSRHGHHTAALFCKPAFLGRHILTDGHGKQLLVLGQAYLVADYLRVEQRQVIGVGHMDEFGLGVLSHTATGDRKSTRLNSSHVKI